MTISPKARISAKDTILTGENAQRAKANFRLRLQYARDMYRKGISIRIGTDSAHGGKAMESEQVLMAENGFTIAQIMQICTINGARALGVQDKYGAAEKGMWANLVIFQADPFDNYRNFTGEKVVIKEAVIGPLK